MPADPELRRRSFDRHATVYATARPPYPPELYQTLADHCGLTAGSSVLEIGPGTGQATAELLARGATVTAVEPGRRLAEILTQRHGGDRLTVLVDDVERAELPAGRFDLVTCATAFHWVDPAATLPRLARALAPGGWLAVWWTVFGDPSRRTPFRLALNQLYRDHLPHEWLPLTHQPGPLRTESWSAELRGGGWFGPVEVEQFRWDHPLTAEGARQLWSSFPNIMELAPPERAAFLDRVAGLVEANGGCVADPYVTILYRTRPAR